MLPRGKDRLLAERAMSFATYPSLRDAVVYITGGASGIGAEMVRAFAEQGSRVGFVDIAENLGRMLAAELVEAKQRVHFEPCDLRDIGALKAAFARLEERHRTRWGACQQRRE